jgi:hypothetical protein
MKKILAAATVLALTSAASAATYVGNGTNGFGGPIGQGSLDITDNGTQLTVTLTRGPGDVNDSLVLYVDGQAGGITTTAGLTDETDDGIRAISGVSGSGATRSTVNFPAGFTADRALVVAGGFSYGSALAPAATFGSTAFPSVSHTGANNAVTITSVFNLSDLGLSGNSFNFVGTYLNRSNSFRSNETLGGASNADGTGSANIGNGPNAVLTFTSSSAYTLVPEPTTLGLLAASSLVLLRRKK